MDKDEGAVEEGRMSSPSTTWEVDDEGNEVDGTKREDFVFTVGSGYNYYKIDDEVLGMDKGASRRSRRHSRMTSKTVIWPERPRSCA